MGMGGSGREGLGLGGTLVGDVRRDVQAGRVGQSRVAGVRGGVGLGGALVDLVLRG